MNVVDDIVNEIHNGVYEGNIYANGVNVEWGVDDQGFYSETLNNNFETEQSMCVWDDNNVTVKMIMPIDNCIYTVEHLNNKYLFTLHEDNDFNLAQEGCTPMYDNLTLEQEAINKLLPNTSSSTATMKCTVS